MRGAQPTFFDDMAGQWIIPADAGSTQVLIIKPETVKDHPRGCGEHLRAMWHAISETGSSPRMRGAHTHDDTVSPEHGIIPADAGSTSFRC